MQFEALTDTELATSLFSCLFVSNGRSAETALTSRHKMVYLAVERQKPETGSLCERQSMVLATGANTSFLDRAYGNNGHLLVAHVHAPQ